MSERVELKQGSDLYVTIGDFDAEDMWIFRVLSAEPDLSLRWRLLEEGADEAELDWSEEFDPYARMTVGAAALEAGEGVLSASQGSMETSMIAVEGASRRYEHVPDGRTERDVPPFLLSRKDYQTLKSAGRVKLQPLWDATDLDEFELKEERTYQLEGADGELRSVTALHLVGSESEAEISVLDDPQWPLVLERSEAGGDNILRITALR